MTVMLTTALAGPAAFLATVHLVVAGLLGASSVRPPSVERPSVQPSSPRPSAAPSLAARSSPVGPVAVGPVAAGPMAVEPAARWPLSPRPEVVARFDPPPTRYAAGHRGVDLLARAGQPVLAALGGRVTYAGGVAGRGVVVITHGATRTTYQPVTATVRVGEVVAAGTPIGRLEATGGHCLPRLCLHWGLLRDETYLDPLRLLGLGPVRLLPWAG
jgi:murein DD-endopeptidase MepM/ murein hydrolase activator NlpD